LQGVVLACDGSGRFASATLEGDWLDDEVELRQHARSGGGIVTDLPARAADLLGQKGITPLPELWDILELAALVLPRCRTDSLDYVGAYLGVDPPDDDSLRARASLLLRVFQGLIEATEALGLPTLLTLNRLAMGLEWPLRSLFRALERRAPSSDLHGALANAAPLGAWLARPVPPRRPKSSHAGETSAAIDTTDLAARFATGGPLARALVAYEPRLEQVRMAQHVAGTLNVGGHLLVEAGTGTGKGLAYLLPAAVRALAADQRVVVSTATTNLQDQLFEHDLPLVAAALGPEMPLRAAVLKGRGNYLCLQRWQLLTQSQDLAIEERTLLIKTLFWLPRTETGDRAELHLTPGEEEAWLRLSATTEACTPTRCTYHRIGVCFLARARRIAEDSHIVITNHALLLTDLVTRSRVLPDYDVLILDEAHHLEDEATAQLGWRIGERELLARLDALWSPGHGASGLVPQAASLLTLANGTQLPDDLLQELRTGENAVLQLGMSLRVLYEGFQRVWRENESKDDTTLRVTAAVRAGTTWQEVEATWVDAQQQLQAVERTVATLVESLREAPPALDRAKELIGELGGHMEYWRDQRRRISRALQQPPPDVLYWLSLNGRAAVPVLNAAPLEVGTLLRERLFARPHASVLVSATLAVDGSFDFLKRRLGLEEAESAALGSPFDFERAALLYVPNDLPDPTQPGYQAHLEHVILDVVGRLRGRTLVLFTSRAHLRATYQALREPLLKRHITLLGQGVDETSRTRLLSAFRGGSRVALFGTSAFWEGIDVVGDALSCVIVARLPFSVPTDPVYSARAELFDEPFIQYAVPQAVLRLKQGFGRLIRSRSDRGAVVVLDRRLVTRFYGQHFLRSLPASTVRQGPLRRTGVEVEEWLGRTAEQLSF
jgi:DNA polymerase-3 subunit epsilon/ATP-dependent DNA helicase DinG